jgi:subtilisin family serine protease
MYFLKLCAAAVLALCWAAPGQAQQAAPGRLLVSLAPGIRAGDLPEAYHAEALAGGQAFLHLEGRDLDSCRAALARDPRIRHAEPDYECQAALSPNDPEYARQWGLLNRSQLGGTAGSDIHAPLAWELRTDASQEVLAVFDTGIDWQHPDLAENIWQNLGEDADLDGRVLEWNGSLWVFDPGDQNGLDDDGNGYADDFIGWDFVNQDNDPRDDHLFGHGTHVAGIAGARGGNGQGIAGVAWRTRLMPLKFLNANGTGYVSGALQALAYAQQMGADVANHSWGSPAFSQLLSDAFAQTLASGMIHVAAAGNNYGLDIDLSPIYPAAFSFSHVISVTASDTEDRLTNFANIGPLRVDLAAPGYGIYSTLPGGGYGFLSGTSMAAPFVAGALALMKAQFPGAGTEFLSSRLLRFTDPVAGLAGKCLSGGRLNLFRALSKPAYFQRTWQSDSSQQLSGLSDRGREGFLLSGQRGSRATLTRVGIGGQTRWERRFSIGNGIRRLLAVPDTGSTWLAAAEWKDAQGTGRLALFALDSAGNPAQPIFRTLGENFRLAALIASPQGACLAGTRGNSLYLATWNGGGLNWETQIGIPGAVFQPQVLRRAGGQFMAAGTVSENGGPPAAFLLLVGEDGQAQELYRYDFPGLDSLSCSDIALRAMGSNDDDDDEIGGSLLLAGSAYDNGAHFPWLLTLNLDGSVATGQRYDWAIVPGSLSLVLDFSLRPALAATQQATPGGTAAAALLLLDADGTPQRAIRYLAGGQPARLRSLAFSEGGYALAGESSGKLLLIKTDEEGGSGCPDSLLSLPGHTSVSALLSLPAWQQLGGLSSPLSGPSLAVLAQSSAAQALCDNSNCNVQAFFRPGGPACEDEDLLLLNLSQQASSFVWRENGVIFSTGSSPLLSDVDDDSLLIELTASDGTCSDKYSLTIVVSPSLQPLPIDTVHCGPSVRLRAGLRAATYAWLDGNGALLSSDSVFIANASGNYTLAVEDACGESETASVQVALQPDCVWPGDANADGTVNVHDYLTIALAHGSSGPPRAGASSSYTGQIASPWAQSHPAGSFVAPAINYHHSDSDGNGQVNLDLDGAIVAQNASPERYRSQASASSPITVTVETQQSSVWAGEPIAFEVKLDLPAGILPPDAHGIAFRLNYNLPVQFNPSVAPGSTWLGGSGLNVLSIPYPGQNRFDVAITRRDQANVQSNGQIALMCCIIAVIDDIGNYSASSEQAFLSISLSDATIIQGDGSLVPINDVSAQGAQGVLIQAPFVRVSPRLWLQGAYDAAAGKMRTDLQAQGRLPLLPPYGLPGAVPVASIDPDIVDWVLVELYEASSAPGASPVAQAAAWLTEYGSVIDPLTRGPLRLNAIPGAYRLAVRHRNHLAVATDTAVQLSNGAPALLDFRQAGLGTLRAEVAPGVWALAAGDLDQNLQVQYSGPGNDRRLILERLGQDPAAQLIGYWAEDANLDGAVRYLGPGNDRELILQSVGAGDPARILSTQIP